MLTEPAFYEERRHWTPQAALGTAIVVPLVASSIAAVVTMHLWLFVPFAAFFAIGLAGLSYGAATHAPALRLDAQGISLARTSIPGRVREPVLVPWPEMRAVVLDSAPRNKNIDALYVLTKADETLSGTTLYDLTDVSRHIPTRRCLPLTNWSINVDRLSEAVHAHAPTVAVLDQR